MQGLGIWFLQLSIVKNNKWSSKYNETVVMDYNLKKFREQEFYNYYSHKKIICPFMSSILLICVLILLQSCSSNKNDKLPKIINIDVDGIQESRLNIKIKKLIRIELTNNSIVGRTNTVRYHKERFYILDQMYSKALFVFNNQGNFINKTVLGRGPGEISEPWAFDIDEDRVIVHDQGRQELVTFDLDLNYINRKRHDTYICDFAKVDSNRYLVRSYEFIKQNRSSNSDKNVTYALFSDEMGEPKLLDVEVGSQTSSRIMGSPINTFNGKTIFVPAHDYNIFELKDESAKAIYRVDLGHYKFSQQELSSLGSMEMIQLEREGERIGRFNSVINSNNFLVFSLGLYPYKTYFYSYSNYTTYKLDDCIENNLIPACGVWGLIEQNTFFATVKPQDLKEFAKSSGKYQDVEISEKDNRYIIIFEVLI